MIPVPLLLEAYQRGYFPMAIEPGEIRWFSPDPRGIIPLDSFHLPRRLVRELKTHPFDISVDIAFRDVITACASREADEGNWINETIVSSYCELHARGLAHSVETWRDGQLVGGLYGVSLGAAFFGESMFNRASNASKAAMGALVARLRERGYELLDVQWLTPYLQTFGAIEIPRDEYLRRLRGAIGRADVVTW